LVPFLLILFLLSLGIQLYFILNVFNKINQYEAPVSDLVALPPVSVIVCSWNEIRNLEELLPMLDAQEYPKFEIIVVDDRSYDGTYDFL
jgi:cellulose synthase/poly-beta-1,6-N-acetylglucosamine synthase-like glycosyltransferase